MGYIKGSPRERFNDKWFAVTESGCWIWVGQLNQRGYGVFDTPRESDGKWCGQLAHRISWIFYRGLIPAGHGVFHHCDVLCCVNPWHLFTGFQVDNVHDMIRKGRDRKAYGEAHPKATLDASKVQFIRSNRGLIGRRKMAKLLGVTHGAIAAVLLGRTWKHVP